MKRLLFIVLCMALALPMMAQEEELCIDGVLLFREDFGGNDESDSIVSKIPVPGMSYMQITGLETGAAGGSMASGRYLVTKRGYRNSSDKNYSQWHIMDDHTYDEGFTVLDTTVFPDRIPQKGYFMEIDGDANKSKAFYKTTLHDLCAGTHLSFSAYIANVVGYWQIENWGCGYPRLRFEIKDPVSNNIIAVYETGDIQPDWSFKGENGKSVVPGAWKWSAHWQQVGMTFNVPEGIDYVELAIYNNYESGCSGNDFAMDDIEIRLCAPPVDIVSEHEVCENTAYQFAVDYTNDGSIPEPLEYQWYFSADSAVWTEVTDGNIRNLAFAHTAFDNAGWYQLAVAGSGNINRPNCRTMSEPFHLTVNQCCPAVMGLIRDTVVCDTLMPFRWRDTLFTEPATFEFMLTDQRGCDSVQCLLTLDTVHCERLYPLIVNKYNWVLLLDNVTLARLFPDRFVRGLQWYRDEKLIPGATDDDYSEQNELHGRFQLRLELDDNQTIWSNILEINAEQMAQPIQVYIYDSRGMSVRENQITHGIYLYRYEQGDRVWTEKKLIP